MSPDASQLPTPPWTFTSQPAVRGRHDVVTGARRIHSPLDDGHCVFSIADQVCLAYSTVGNVSVQGATKHATAHTPNLELELRYLGTSSPPRREDIFPAMTPSADIVHLEYRQTPHSITQARIGRHKLRFLPKVLLLALSPLGPLGLNTMRKATAPPRHWLCGSQGFCIVGLRAMKITAGMRIYILSWKSR
jgi:hypothetical protein